MDKLDSIQNSAEAPEGVNESLRVSLCDSAPFVLPLEQPPGIPAFQPARGLSSSHAQTLLGTLFSGSCSIAGTTARRVRLEDGDMIVLHDDCPNVWNRGDHVVLMLHGLCGSHQSGYMVRLTRRLNTLGVRTFRMDHRGCGAGLDLARKPYHAGRTEDLSTAVQTVERLCPGSPISLVGFSLSGNLLLKYLGQRPDRLPLSLFRAVAVCPPIDLQACTTRLQETTMGQRYDWYFTRKLVSQIADSPQWRDDVPLASSRRPPRRLYDFDDLYTAPASGFESADHYYEEASAVDVISRIRVHTTILASEDDPVVSPEPLKSVKLPPNLTLCLTKHGGHLGFIGRAGIDPDRRWMDWRLVDWLLT